MSIQTENGFCSVPHETLIWCSNMAVCMESFLACVIAFAFTLLTKNYQHRCDMLGVYRSSLEHFSVPEKLFVSILDKNEWRRRRRHRWYDTQYLERVVSLAHWVQWVSAHTTSGVQLLPQAMGIWIRRWRNACTGACCIVTPESRTVYHELG